MLLKKIVRFWLLLGLVLLLFQVFIGGITRLTGSGLSITKWEIITGTIPPLNGEQWQHEFDLYKQTPQYQKINEGMSLGEFKWIYFWEYFHRLWARSMGFIFLFPFLFFLYKRWLPRTLIVDLIILIVLTIFAASFGWIMVASGLIDRPWVNAYKLTGHLSSALLVVGWMAWIVYKAWFPRMRGKITIGKWPLILLIGIAIQIMLGGIMSGSKAGLFFPTWPDMNGEILPSTLMESSNWIWDNFNNYDQNAFFPALIQFTHRMMAYILAILACLFLLTVYNRGIFDRIKWPFLTFGILMFLQIIVGISTILACKGVIPVGLGILHQSLAILLLLTILFISYLTDRKRIGFRSYLK